MIDIALGLDLNFVESLRNPVVLDVADEFDGVGFLGVIREDYVLNRNGTPAWPAAGQEKPAITRTAGQCCEEKTFQSTPRVVTRSLCHKGDFKRSTARFRDTLSEHVNIMQSWSRQQKHAQNVRKIDIFGAV